MIMGVEQELLVLGEKNYFDGNTCTFSVPLSFFMRCMADRRNEKRSPFVPIFSKFYRSFFFFAVIFVFPQPRAN